MPSQLSYPGVYVEEISSGVHSITGVSTSVTAFVGYTARGFDHRATRIFSFADFERAFGGLAPDSELSYAVQHFFANGGGEGVVVRVPKADSVAASITLLDNIDGTGKEALTITALSKGAWANDVVIEVDYDGVADTKSFNLTITDLGAGTIEEFDNVTMDPAEPNYVVAVMTDPDSGSELVSVVVPDATAGPPAESGTVGGNIDFADLEDNDPTKNYTIKILSDLPAGAIDKVVALFDAGETMPTSVLGLCRLLERKINLALKDVPGAAVTCVPSSSGKGVRVIADFAAELGVRDPQITFDSGPTNSALTDMKLGADSTANVARYWLGKGRNALGQKDAVEGEDGVVLPMTGDLIGKEADFSGIYALEKVDIFNLLCIPDATRAQPGNPAKIYVDPTDPNNVLDPNAVFADAMTYCRKRRAFLLIDPPPEVNNVQAAADWKFSGLTVHEKDGAAFFPRLRLADPLNDYQLRTFAPSGVVAGLFARIDASRGVWKAPAGTEATLTGVQGLVYKLTDAENGALNPLGLNCFRNFPIYGNISWGARTLVGSDAEGSEWKYIPVRRMALYLEESLFRGTKWVVFEPNDEPLWSQIRLNITTFMQGLFRQGAFQGKTPRDAYLVKCDKETTTQADINLGVVNILVGFAPLKPAEFVIIKIQQLAGQTQA